MKLFGNFQKRDSLQKGTAQMEAARRFEIAMFQPDQAGNVGAAARLTACMGLALHVIEPCGFPLDDQRIRRAGMDYLDFATIRRHVDWRAFQRAMTVPVAAMPRRLVLLSTQAACRYDQFAFQPGDVLLLGSESSGVPPQIHAEAHERIRFRRACMRVP